MQVFKLYFKLLRKNAVSILIYTGIFLGILVINTTSSNDRETNTFYETKVDIAFVNHDENSELIKGFKDYLTTNCNIVDVGTSKEKLQDALFFRKVEYIVTIPKGFTEEFMAHKNVNIQKQSVPDSTTATFLDNKINNYFNAAKSYHNSFEDMTQSDIASSVAKDLDTKIVVNIQKSNSGNDGSLKLKFFDFYAYGIMSALVMGISLIMLTYRKLDIKRRSLCAPISNFSFQMQSILGNLVFTIASATILITIGLQMINQFTIDKTTLLYILNAFIFSACALGIAYLIGIVVKSTSAVNAAANVVGLGLSFVSGVFVPLQYLGDTAINIGRFTPTYWYVMANKEINKVTNYTLNNMSDVFKYMSIEIAFTIALFTISLVVSKNTNTREC